MASLKEIKNRITSVKATVKITSAMKMVAASKLKKAQDAIIGMRPFTNKLEEMLLNLVQSVEGDFSSVYTTKKPLTKVLAVVVTSNKGLCGAFNSSVIKKARAVLGADYREASVSVMPIGKKAAELLSKTHHIVDDKSAVWDALGFEASQSITKELMAQFAEGTYDKIVIIHNSFKNAATSLVQVVDYLPISIPIVKSQNNTDYIFEPDQEALIAQMIPKYLEVLFYKILRDSLAAEHASRVVAMQQATDNANELQKELNLTYNKARQAAITNEILEIVGGAEALNG